MKISKFCLGLELTHAATFLAVYGSVMAFIGMIGGGISFALPFLIKIQQSVISQTLFSSAFIIIWMMLGWLFFSIYLYEKNSNNDMEGVKQMMKIGSYNNQ